jgi:hypothetical protein
VELIGEEKSRGAAAEEKLVGGREAAMDEGKKKWVAWAAAAAIFVVLMLVTPAIPQDEDYHDFADQRSLFLGTLHLNLILDSTDSPDFSQP